MGLNTFAFMNNSIRQLIKMSSCSYVIGGEMMEYYSSFSQPSYDIIWLGKTLIVIYTNLF